ncbi:hypothetical protein BCR44DRAFT_1425276, partial [Catenaria anguillulae PL171]
MLSFLSSDVVEPLPISPFSTLHISESTFCVFILLCTAPHPAFNPLSFNAALSHHVHVFALNLLLLPPCCLALTDMPSRSRIDRFC